MKTDDFDYKLPDELIAQEPAEPRDSCKMLVLDRVTGEIEHKHFFDIYDYLEPGDVLVANKTRVLPARLLGQKEQSGGQTEVLLLKRREDIDGYGHVWECLVKPGKRLKQGARIEFFEAADPSLQKVMSAEIIGYVEDSRGGRLVRFEPVAPLSLDEAIHAAGKVPLPPYITKYAGDPEKYQTVYSMQEEHSAAAPTAGLHFTDELIEKLKAKGVEFLTVELEVGIDTFRLVEEDDPRDHVIHTERYHVDQEVVDKIKACKRAGKKVVAVGTTSVRSLESAFDEAAEADAGEYMVARYFEDAPDSAKTKGAGNLVERLDATTSLYLMPGSTFHVVDAMITNFHVPRSTLMMLVSAFASREQIMDAYASAIDEHYRFLSFGDAMFIK